MCLVKPPKIPEPQAPAAPPPVPEESAAYTQGSPERPWKKKKYKGNLRDSLRIDMKDSDMKKITDRRN